MGIPVIGTDVGGIPDLIIKEGNRQNGYLLGSNPSPEEISGIICHYIEISDEEKSKLRDNARILWKSTFNSRNNARKFVENLEKLLGYNK